MNYILPDVLDYNLDVVFCGTAVGNKSALIKAYYAGKGNLFYQTLHNCGFTPFLLNSEEYEQLLTYKIGLTDLAKNTKGMDSNIKDSDYDLNGFEEKILRYRPKIVCFNGKKSAKIYFQYKTTKMISLGLQEKTIKQTKIFVAPSTSPTAKKYWDEKLWKELKKVV